MAGIKFLSINFSFKILNAFDLSTSFDMRFGSKEVHSEDLNLSNRAERTYLEAVLNVTTSGT